MIAPLDTDQNRQIYREGGFPRADRVKDLDMRYRWDLFHAANTRSACELSRTAYDEGLNDNHIDTVLRSIVPKL